MLPTDAVLFEDPSFKVKQIVLGKPVIVCIIVFIYLFIYLL